MTDLTHWHEVAIPVRVLSYTPGRPATFYDPAEPAEVEWEIDAPAEVRAWLMAQLGDDGCDAITHDLIEQAKENRREAKSFARAVEAELAQWDRERQRQADYAYDPLGVDR